MSSIIQAVGCPSSVAFTTRKGLVEILKSLQRSEVATNYELIMHFMGQTGHQPEQPPIEIEIPDLNNEI